MPTRSILYLSGFNEIWTFLRTQSRNYPGSDPLNCVEICWSRKINLCSKMRDLSIVNIKAQTSISVEDITVLYC